MADFRHDPETGQEYVYEPGEGVWKPVTPEEADAWEMGTLERLGRAGVDAGIDSVGMALEGISGSGPVGAVVPGMGAFDLGLRALGVDNPLAQPGQAIQATTDERQAARSQVSPATEFIGSLALDPTNLIPMGGLAKAVKGVPGQTAMSPLAQRVVASADEVVQSGRGRAADEALDIQVDGLPAGAARDPETSALRGAVEQAGAVRGMPGGESGAADVAAGWNLKRVARMIFRDADPKIASVKAADDLGIPLTDGMRRGSRSQQTAEEGLQRDPGVQEVFNKTIGQPTEDITVNNVRRAFGLGPGNKLTREDFRMASDALDAEFADIADGIPGKSLILPDDATIMKNNITGATDDIPARRKVYDRFVRAFDENASGKSEHPMDQVLFSEARMSARDIWGKVRELDKAIVEAGSDGERLAMQAVRDFWWDRMMKLAGSEGGVVSDRIKNANEKFRVKKLLEKPGVMKEDGVSVRSLSNQARTVFGDAMRRDDFKDGKGRRFQPDTVNLIKNMQVIRDFPNVLPNSGTPTGMLLTGGLQKATARMMANRVGAQMYFGNPVGAAKAAATSAPVRYGAVGLGGVAGLEAAFGD